MNASLFSAKVFKKLDIREHLFNSIKQKDINNHLFKNFIISLVVLPFFALVTLWGKGTLGMYSRGLVSSFSFVDGSSKSEGITWVVFITCISLSFRKVMTASTSLWCCTFRIGHWLTWEFAFLNGHYQGLNWRGKLAHHLLKVWDWLGLWTKVNPHLISQLVNGMMGQIF